MRATVHSIVNSQTRLKWLSMHACMCLLDSVTFGARVNQVRISALLPAGSVNLDKRHDLSHPCPRTVLRVKSTGPRPPHRTCACWRSTYSVPCDRPLHFHFCAFGWTF